MAEDEDGTFSMLRKLLSFLPSNNLEDAPLGEQIEAGPVEALKSIVPAEPNKGYDVRDIIRGIVDGGDFFEVQPLYAMNIVSGFGRVQGQSVGVIANQPKVLAGCLDINASDKAARFIRFCDAFNIPVLNVVDVPGFLPGTNQELGGIIRHGAKMLYAYSEATVPKISLIVRKSYGGAYLAMCSRDLGADYVAAWPNAEIAVMGPDGAANIIFRKEIEGAEDKNAKRKEKINEYRDTFANPYVAASRGYIDDVIEPAETRMKVAKALEMLASKRETRPAKKHGNLPV
jgi:acetyl-CoA carboxylase carboxyltransferase component